MANGRRTMLAAVVALSAVARVASQGAPTPCDEVDDDSIYNQTSCYSYDIDACKNNCPSNTMCDYFCGSGDDSCANGGGAVCSMRALSDIETTCNTVWSLTDDVLAAYTPSPDVDFDTTTMHMGCDKHVYCEFCTNSTACLSIVDNMAEGVLGDTLYHKYYEYGGNLIYYGPMAMALLANITAVCDEMFPVEDRLTVSHTTTTSCGKGCSKTVETDDTTAEPLDQIAADGDAAAQGGATSTQTAAASTQADTNQVKTKGTKIVEGGGSALGSPTVEVLDEATCSACDGLSDKACLSALDDEYDAMSDKIKLSYLRDAYPGYDSSLTDKACLAALEAELASETDKTRLSLLKEACVAYSADTDTASAASMMMLKATDSSSCGYCDGLSDKVCLATLDALYDDMSDKTKLSFLRDAIPDYDADMTDKACLTALDAELTGESDKTRLATLKAGCAAYYATGETLAQEGDEGAAGWFPSTPQLVLGSGMGLGLVAVNLVARRRRNGYQLVTGEEGDEPI